tara:strand:+ start:25337 stop:25498 length:162 start_codon:yes stop_codon:yes gene_type:complete
MAGNVQHQLRQELHRTGQGGLAARFIRIAPLSQHRRPKPVAPFPFYQISSMTR